MRILIFHGYLLRGTGSNIYNASLVRALARLGHEVDLLCQDRDWEAPEGVTIHNPDIGRVLPVYVADRYEGFDAKPYAELSDAELEHYLASNVAAVQDAPTPDVALANHLVMGPAIVARALAGRAPYAVKVHGSALEYTVRPHRERFLPYALEGVRGASGVLVGSRHTAESLWEVLADEPELPQRTRLGPPGVDVHEFRPGSGDLEHLAARVAAGDAAAWGGEAGAADALRSLDPDEDRIVSFVGKLIVSKGVDLLLAAWPLVVARVPEARLAIVGFGTYREALGRFVDALRRRRPGRPARDRGARARAGGRPAGRAEVPARVPRGGRARVAGRGAGGGRARALHRPARARRPARPAPALRGAGDAEHVPGGLRDGGGRGGRVRRAAAVGRAFGDGGGHGDAGARAGAAAAAVAVVRRRAVRRSSRSPPS